MNMSPMSLPPPSSSVHHYLCCLCVAIAVVRASPLLSSVRRHRRCPCITVAGEGLAMPENVLVPKEDPLCSIKSANIQAKRKEKKMYCLPQYVADNAEKDGLPQGQHAMHQCAFCMAFVKVAKGGEELAHNDLGHCFRSGECQH